MKPIFSYSALYDAGNFLAPNMLRAILTIEKLRRKFISRLRIPATYATKYVAQKGLHSDFVRNPSHQVSIHSKRNQRYILFTLAYQIVGYTIQSRWDKLILFANVLMCMHGGD